MKQTHYIRVLRYKQYRNHSRLIMCLHRYCNVVAGVELTNCVLSIKELTIGKFLDKILQIFPLSVLEHPHSARVSLISLLMVVLTEVPRESVIWNVIL